MSAIEHGYKVPILVPDRPMACPEPNMFKFIKITKMDDQVKKFMDVQAECLKAEPKAEPKPVRSLKRPWESTQDDEHVNKKPNTQHWFNKRNFSPFSKAC